jgi:hypothetical protein
VTGWRKVNWTESTIEMLIFDRTTGVTNLPAGAYIRTDALGMTADPCKEGDQVFCHNSYYEVEGVKEVYDLDSFVRRDCDLAKLPLYQASFSSTATWKTSPYDPRYLTRVMIESYARDAQITKDDGSTQASWATIFENPPYPLALEFSQVGGVDGLYVISQANTTPEVSGDQVTRRYEEKVPIHISTVDRTDCTGTALQWKMEAELRWILETQPTGSQRGLEKRISQDRSLGSMWLYDQEYTLSYKRGTST